MQRILVVAPRGKMGKLIVQAVHEREDMVLSGALAAKGRDYAGMDCGMVAGLGIITGAPVYDDIDKAVSSCDTVIDFSMTEVSSAVLEKAVEHGKSIVCGTTGFTPDEMRAFEIASKKIPVLYAANTSTAVNCMNRLLEMAARMIGEKSDIEIIEMHDRNKLDAPSGTSKEMGHIIAESLGLEFDEAARYGRSGRGKRSDNEIGYHSIRSGDISSSHTVIFGMMGERLEITHHAYNWTCFARGACDCAKFLEGRGPGLYGVRDVIKL